MEGVAADNLQWSLPVPSVQELAAQGVESVPQRYIRDDDLGHQVPSHSARSLHVPVIDMANLANPLAHDFELQKLHSACMHWGMFQVINHKVSDEKLRNMQKQALAFFELPLREKKRWAQKPGCLEGYGQAFVTSDEQKLEWNDMMFLTVFPARDRKLELWPQEPQNFSGTLESYVEDVSQLAVRLTRFIEMALKLKDGEFHNAYEQGTYTVRLNYYPPCPEPNRVLGLNPHADISGITLLLDCGDMPALQTLKDGKWVFVEPVPGAFVATIGQITEIMSNGIYKAAEHRVAVNNSKERLSIASFCYPSSSCSIGPAKELVDRPGNTALFKTVTYEEYIHRFFNRELHVPFIDGFKIEDTHLQIN